MILMGLKRSQLAFYLNFHDVFDLQLFAIISVEKCRQEIKTEDIVLLEVDHGKSKTSSPTF